MGYQEVINREPENLMYIYSGAVICREIIFRGGLTRTRLASANLRCRTGESPFREGISDAIQASFGEGVW